MTTKTVATAEARASDLASRNAELQAELRRIRVEQRALSATAPIRCP